MKNMKYMNCKYMVRADEYPEWRCSLREMEDTNIYDQIIANLKIINNRIFISLLRCLIFSFIGMVSWNHCLLSIYLPTISFKDAILIYLLIYVFLGQ